jgi:predicted  nucleic acid-binding Zn-ribbon protein
VHVPDDDIEARVRQLEQGNATDRGRLTGIIERADRELYPLVELFGRLDERFNHLLKDVGNAHDRIRDLEHEIGEAREEIKQHAQVTERVDQFRLENRRLVYGLLGIFITAAGTLLTAILTGGPS